MKYKEKSHWLTVTFAAVALSAFAHGANAHWWGPPHESPEVIIEWNQLTQTSIPLIAPPAAPFAQTRMYAMVHVAMTDAVNAIDRSYDPFHVQAWAPRGASAEAAAAQAGHDVLVALIPAAAGTLDAALAARLDDIPTGPRGLGVQVGKKVAAAVLDWRADDGFANANPQPPALPPAPPIFLLSTLPGIWVPTGTGSTAGTFANLGAVAPFGLITPTQFLPAPFPQLETARYADDFDEVKTEGERPAAFPGGPFSDNHRIALTWAGGAGTPHANVTNPFRLWSNIARDVAEEEGFSLTKTARLFALLTTSIHDSVQTSHTSKFIYMLWRPETAIARAGSDNNAATGEQPGWIPLLVTPPYPSHASNMTCIGAGAARMLRNVFRGEKSFTATWYESDTVTPPATTPPVERSQLYDTFWDLALEEGDSRIWGGIHFRFEIDTSLVACSNVADYLYDNYLLPRAHGHF
jgi:hypothetical protein